MSVYSCAVVELKPYSCIATNPFDVYQRDERCCNLKGQYADRPHFLVSSDRFPHLGAFKVELSRYIERFPLRLRRQHRWRFLKSITSKERDPLLEVTIVKLYDELSRCFPVSTLVFPGNGGDSARVLPADRTLRVPGAKEVGIAGLIAAGLFEEKVFSTESSEYSLN